MILRIKKIKEYSLKDNLELRLSLKGFSEKNASLILPNMHGKEKHQALPDRVSRP